MNNAQKEIDHGDGDRSGSTCRERIWTECTPDSVGGETNLMLESQTQVIYNSVVSLTYTNIHFAFIFLVQYDEQY